MRKTLAPVLAVLISCALAASAAEDALVAAGAPASLALGAYKAELFSRAWVSVPSASSGSCAKALRGVRPLFLLPADEAVVEGLISRAQAAGTQVGPECRTLVVSALGPELGEDTAAQSRLLPAKTLAGSIKDAVFPVVVAAAPQSSPAADAPRAHDPLYWGSLAFAAGGAGFDLATTEDAIGRGAGREGNPVIAAFGATNRTGVAVMAIGTQTAAALFTHYFLYKRGHRRLAIALNAVMGGAHVAAGVHNLGVR